MIRRIIAVVLVLSFVPLPSWATNAVVQSHVTGIVYDYGSGITNTYSSAVTPGNLLVLVIGNAPAAITSVSDPSNGNWTMDYSCTRTYDGAGNSIWSVHNTGNTALTVTIITTAGTGYFEFIIYEISGPPSTNYVDATASDNSNLQPSVTLTTVSANDTVIASVLSYAIITASNDSGFTVDMNDAFTYTSVESNPDIGAASNYTLNFGNPSGNLQANYECIEAIAYKTSGSPPPATATSTNLPMMGI